MHTNILKSYHRLINWTWNIKTDVSKRVVMSLNTALHLYFLQTSVQWKTFLFVFCTFLHKGIKCLNQRQWFKNREKCSLLLNITCVVYGRVVSVNRNKVCEWRCKVKVIHKNCTDNVEETVYIYFLMYLLFVEMIILIRSCDCVYLLLWTQ